MVHPRGHLVSWPTIRALGAGCARNDGFLEMPEFRSIGGLADTQLDALAEEFPEAGTVRHWRPVWLFALALREPERRLLEAADVLAIRKAPTAAQQALLAATQDQAIRLGLNLLTEPRAAVRLVLETTGEGEARRRQLVWEVRLPGGSGSHRATLALQLRRPLKPEAKHIAR